MYSSSGVGSTPHMAFEMFKMMAGIEVLGVQYKGSGPAITDLVGGQVQAIMTGILALTPHIKSGRVKALAVTSPKRNAVLPDLPTIAESGVPGFDIRVWFGVFLPAGAPKSIVALLNERIAKLAALPDVKQRFVNEGADPAPNSPEDFAALVRNDLARWTKVVKTTGVGRRDQ
jgi:tripartite-type tricarboxylate transporter receptor subunit TctC